MLRRLKKSTMKLPPRSDKLVRVQFSEEERAHYSRIEQPVNELLDHSSDTKTGMTGLWFRAMQQIHRLRITCNLLGIHTASSRTGLAQWESSAVDTTHQILSTRLSMNAISCEQCVQVIDFTGSGVTADLLPQSPKSYYSPCLRLFCASCATLLKFEGPSPCTCASKGNCCMLQPFAPSQLTPGITASPSSPSPGPNFQFSSKIQAMVAEIRAYPVEKSVIFSFWTSSLDIVQEALEAASIRCVRIDGKVSAVNRQRALKQLSDNPETKAILLTVSCGAVGIDLTAASRVHLLEPQWNPSLEEQALARVHRIGQTHPVTTIRYVIQDSLEQHIISVQDRKKLLTSLLLSNESSPQVRY
ncbi:MAG: hypothetical protein M1820_002949 [Bogoriella megaspora]|nr:MAG: hypothetical protein M1820_002949 [Bogoriella megaspora]